MNIFRLLGDLSHLASIFILVHKIQKSRSVRGISFKTQLIYLVVFLTRYTLPPPQPDVGKRDEGNCEEGRGMTRLQGGDAGSGRAVGSADGKSALSRSCSPPAKATKRGRSKRKRRSSFRLEAARSTQDEVESSSSHLIDVATSAISRTARTDLLPLSSSLPSSKNSYVDLLTGPYISLYNTVMKLFFIGSSAFVLYLMKFKFRFVSFPFPPLSE
jgi:hypothetical protein